MGKVETLAGMTSPLRLESSLAVRRSAKAGKSPVVLEYGMPYKEIALQIEHFHPNEDLEFRVSFRRGMLSILQGIADRGARVALFYGRGQNSVLTSLLGVDEYGMWLDVGPFPPENKLLLLSDKITFVSVHQHVKIQFAGNGLEEGLFENDKAFYMEFPEHLLRIQRREFFRATLPSSPPVRCMIPVQPENPDDAVIRRAVPVVDISGGGIGLLCGAHEGTFLPGKIFSDCRISIPDVGTLPATIEVRNDIDFTTANNVSHKRVGCSFVHPDNQMNILLQRYVTRLQSESMARQSQ